MRKRENENLFENERITKNKKMMDLKKKSSILLEQKEKNDGFEEKKCDFVGTKRK